MQTVKGKRMFNYFDFKENFLGFCDDNEFLPKDFDTFNSKQRLRHLFLSLNNNISKCSFIFTKYEQRALSKYPLKQAFIYKINSLLPISYVKTHSIKHLHFDLCTTSTLIINNYFHNKKQLIIKSKPKLAAAKVISYAFSNNSMQVLIDKQVLFHEFVLKKIKQLHRDKEVLDLGDAISIKSKGVCAIKIFTSWKNIEVKKTNINKELDDAVKCIKEGEFNQVYLAYPKDEDFNKHIPIYVDELKNKEYKIKVIPYSLRSILR